MRAVAVAGLALLLAPAAHSAPRVEQERRIGSWGIVCAGAPVRRCLATQIVAADPAGRQVLLGVTLTGGERGTVPVLHLRVAPGIDRSAGFGIKIEGATELRLPVDACSFKACETAGRLTPKIRAMFAGARVAQVAWRRGDGKQMLVPVNLRNFEQALTEIAARPRLADASISAAVAVSST